MANFPKILVACPTSIDKNYCVEKWIENVMNFTYPEYDVVMFDNSSDNGKNADYLNNYFKTHYGVFNDKKFKVINSLQQNKIKKLDTLKEKIALSHNDCKNYAISNDYDYLLHLESDVIPPANVIENLLFYKKEVVNALYYSDDGLYRRPMLQIRLKIAENYCSSFWLKRENEIDFINGQLLQVALAGLGCALISKKVLSKITFRTENNDKFPDTLFAEDCERLGISVFVDTKIICEHLNKSWGVYGINYK
jgi:hypothetical protein